MIVIISKRAIHYNCDKSINQPIFIKSSNQTLPDQRTIVNIKQIPVSGEIIIELDGNSDLDKYKISENAYIKVFRIGL